MDESKTKDPIPEAFSSIEEAAEFWDKHSLADYWEETQEVDIEVRIAEGDTYSIDEVLGDDE